jgi:hypothetical protein
LQDAAGDRTQIVDASIPGIPFQFESKREKHLYSTCALLTKRMVTPHLPSTHSFYTASSDKKKKKKTTGRKMY